ncbi:hypothetical protein LguiA_021532 [Lonicera macranthoides]
MSASLLNPAQHFPHPDCLSHQRRKMTSNKALNRSREMAIIASNHPTKTHTHWIGEKCSINITFHPTNWWSYPPMINSPGH